MNARERESQQLTPTPAYSDSDIDDSDIAPYDIKHLRLDNEPDLCLPAGRAYPSLHFHRKLSSLRYTVTVLLFVAFCLFVYSILNDFSKIWVAIGTNFTTALDSEITKLLPAMPGVSEKVGISMGKLLSEIIEANETSDQHSRLFGRTMLLLIGLLFCAMLWPFYKLLWTYAVWFMPNKVMGVRTREVVLLWINMFGKFQLYLVILGVNIMVVLQLNINPVVHAYLPKGAQVLAELSTGLFPALGKMMNSFEGSDGKVVHVLPLPMTIAVGTEVGIGAQIFFVAVALSAIITDLVLRANYFAHAQDVYEVPSKECVVSLAKRSGVAITVFMLTMISVTFGLMLYGMTLDFFTIEYSGILGSMMITQENLEKGQSLPTGNAAVQTFSLMGVFEAIRVSQQRFNGSHALAAVIALAFACLLLVLPLLQLFLMLCMWLIPMSYKNLNICFRCSSSVFTWCLLDVYVVLTGISQYSVPQFIAFKLKDACTPINEFLSHGIGQWVLVKKILFDGEDCFTLDLSFGIGYFLILAACVCHWITYYFTMRNARIVWLSNGFKDQKQKTGWLLVKSKKNRYCGWKSAFIWLCFMPICFFPLDERTDRADHQEDRAGEEEEEKEDEGITDEQPRAVTSFEGSVALCCSSCVQTEPEVLSSPDQAPDSVGAPVSV